LAPAKKATVEAKGSLKNDQAESTPIEVQSTSSSVQSYGVTSLILAVVSFGVSWIPLVGALGIPVGALGLILGIRALILSKRRQGQALGYAIAGSSVSCLSLLVAITITAIIWFTAKSVRDKEDERIATNQKIVPIGVYAADRSLPNALGKSEWADAFKNAVQQGDIQVQITNLVQDEFIAIALAITNVSEKHKIEFKGWGTPEGQNAPKLIDNFGNTYRPNARAGLLLRKAETLQSLHPGHRTQDFLVFESPLENIEFLRLELPASVFGGTGQLRLEISKTMMLLNLAKSKGPKAISELCKLFDNKDDRHVRQMAITLVGDFGQMALEAVLPLAEALKDSEETIRIAALESLAKVGPPAKQVLRALLEMFGDPSVAVRQKVQQAMPRFGVLDSSDFPALSAAVMNDKKGVRLFAIKTLSGINFDSVKIGPMYVRVLKDPDKEIKLIALKSLAKIGPSIRELCFLPLLDVLKDPDPEIRGSATDTLKTIGGVTAADVLVLSHLLKGSILDARNFALYALEQLGPLAKEAVPSLVEGIQTKNDPLRVNMVMVLAKMGPGAKDAIPALAQGMRDNNKDFRSCCSLALGKIGEPAIPVLAELLKDKDPTVRSLAADGLGEIVSNAKSVMPLIANALKDPDPKVRSSAVAGLGKFGPEAKEVKSNLAEVLTDNDRLVRLRTIRALIRIGPNANHLPGLLNALNENDPEINQEAEKALKEIGALDKDAVVHLRNALGSSKISVKLFAARALGEIGPPAIEAVPDLKARLTDNNATVRQSITQALGKIGSTKETSSSLIFVLRDKDPLVSRKAMEALEKIGRLDKNDVPPLVEAYRNGEPPIRAFVASLLAKIGPDAKEAVTTLIKGLSDSDASIRQETLSALGKIGPPAWSAAPSLAKVIKSDPSLQVRKKAVEAIGNIGGDGKLAFGSLIEGLKDKKIQEDAEKAIIKIGSPIVPDLIDALERKLDYDDRIRMIGILGKMGPAAKQAVGFLSNMANTEKYGSIRQAAKDALAKIQMPPANREKK
jgi:HEAT repeat protein